MSVRQMPDGEADNGEGACLADFASVSPGACVATLMVPSAFLFLSQISLFSIQMVQKRLFEHGKLWRTLNRLLLNEEIGGLF